MNKRPSLRPSREWVYSGPARAEAEGDPSWWSAMLALRAAFVAQPNAGSISVPFGGGSLSVGAAGNWGTSMPISDEIASQIDLYLPYCLPKPGGVYVAHIGQSLDGRIATETGESRWVTGDADLLHCHRMRALADAVVVGARTVRMDNPQLTVRRCAGPNPIRVIIDPELNLGEGHCVFRDGAAVTLIAAAQDQANRQRKVHGREVVGVPRSGCLLDIAALRITLGGRGVSVVFIEGGGITISRFLQAGCLDRLQITIAPVIIGSGPPGIALLGDRPLDQALRPQLRRFDLGGDTLFDCQFDA